MLDGISHITTQERVIAPIVTLEILPEELFEKIILFISIEKIGNLISTSRSIAKKGDVIRDISVLYLIDRVHCSAHPMEERYFIAQKLCKIWGHFAEEKMDHNMCFLFRNFWGRGQVPYSVSLGFCMHLNNYFYALVRTFQLGEGRDLDINTLDDIDFEARARIKVAELEAELDPTEIDLMEDEYVARKKARFKEALENQEYFSDDSTDSI